MPKFYLVGEFHGTNESPKACLDIMQRNKIKNLALEFSIDKQKEIDNFLKNKIAINDISIFNVKTPHDGRASPAVKNLLLKAKEKKFSVYLVDSDSKIIKEREKEMAKNLINIKKGIVFLCGNAHASKKEYHINLFYRLIFRIINIFSSKYPKLDKIIKPCGYYLPEKETTSYKIISTKGGKFYNFKIKKAKSYKIKGINYLPKIITSSDKKYDFYYVVESLTESV